MGFRRITPPPLFIYVIASMIVVGMTTDENTAIFISPSNVQIMMKGVFGVPVQYTENNTPARVLIKGGDVVAIYCHGNTARIMEQSLKEDLDGEGYRHWQVFVETNPTQVTKMMSHIPIYCNIINNNPHPEIVPFSLTYSRTEDDPVIRPVLDPSVPMSDLIRSITVEGNGVSNVMIILLSIGVFIVLAVPIVLGIVNSKRVIT